MASAIAIMPLFSRKYVLESTANGNDQRVQLGFVILQEAEFQPLR